MRKEVYHFTKQVFTGIRKTLSAHKDENFIKSEYHLVVIKGTDLKEVFNIALSRDKVYIMFSVVMVLLLTLSFLLFAYTPMKYLLPHYGRYEERKELLHLKKSVDSLHRQMEYNQAFIRQFQSYFTTLPAEYNQEKTKKTRNKK